MALDLKFGEHFRALEGINSFPSFRSSLVMSFGAFKPCLRPILSLRSRSEVATSDPCLFWFVIPESISHWVEVGASWS